MRAASSLRCTCSSSTLDAPLVPAAAAASLRMRCGVVRDATALSARVRAASSLRCTCSSTVLSLICSLRASTGSATKVLVRALFSFSVSSGLADDDESVELRSSLTFGLYGVSCRPTPFSTMSLLLCSCCATSASPSNECS